MGKGEAGVVRRAPKGRMAQCDTPLAHTVSLLARARAPLCARGPARARREEKRSVCAVARKHTTNPRHANAEAAGARARDSGPSTHHL